MAARTITLALLAGAALWAGCTVKERAVAPHEVTAVDSDRWLAVQRIGHGELLIRDASVESGLLRGSTRDGAQLAIPLDSIWSVSLRQTSSRTLIALVPVLAVAAWLQHGAQTAPPRQQQVSSCPFVYAHDGESLVFQAEPFGGAIVPALERTEWSTLPDLRAVEGEYRLRIANELDETEYIDEARLVVVDHPAGTRVAADAYGGFHLVREALAPMAVRDSRGRDLAALFRDTDRRAWFSSYDSMDAHIRETLRDPLVLEFPGPQGARTARLLVNGATSPWGAQVAHDFLALRGAGLHDWYRALDGPGPELMELLDWFGREGLYLLPIEVATPTGWEERDALFGSGPFAYKTTAYTLDVSDVRAETLRVRLQVPVGFWVFNSVAVSYDDSPPVHGVELETTTLHDDRGRALRSLLSADDGRALVLAERGDYVDLVYPVPPPTDEERTVFLKITGYYQLHLPTTGEPDAATIARLLQEPGYTLRFAHDRYLRHPRGAVGSR